MASKKKQSNELEFKTTPVFTKNLEVYMTGFNYIINQGGSRSSKTYSICQLLIYLAINKKLTISIVRKSMPSLRASVMKDIFEIMKESNIYGEQFHNKSDNVYYFPNGSEIEFFSLDDEQKIRGRKRDILYCNEANELSYEEFNQLMLRTNGACFMDFNPSDSEHFIYQLLEDPKSYLIKSTYKDNPFLSKTLIDYIENLINTDENYYKIYALGERPSNQTRIYSHFKKYVDEPKYTDYAFGLDFGYNHPTALTKIMYVGDKIYVKELIYESKLTTADLIKQMDLIFTDADRNKPIFCDYSRPESIEELKRYGYNAKPADKLIKDGIDYIKSSEIYLSEDSVNIWKEYKLYCWKSKGNIIYDEPVKENDDALDSIRYAVFTQKKRGSGKFDYHFAFI